jgi:hypothetical protein
MEMLAKIVNNMNGPNRGVNNDLDELHKWLMKQSWFLRMYTSKL